MTWTGDAYNPDEDVEYERELRQHGMEPDTDDLDSMSRRDLVELLEAYNESVAEVKRLREAIADVANNMEAADPSLLRSFIRDLLEVIE